mmetsp:Transcript_19801/g.55679  ORF Transcript_19801/g.55679 Transcript_19801/m.55679 type:complete len:290 (+) Transcript_19801:86-955(+)
MNGPLARDGAAAGSGMSQASLQRRPAADAVAAGAPQPLAGIVLPLLHVRPHRRRAPRHGRVGHPHEVPVRDVAVAGADPRQQAAAAALHVGADRRAPDAAERDHRHGLGGRSVRIGLHGPRGLRHAPVPVGCAVVRADHHALAGERRARLQRPYQLVSGGPMFDGDLLSIRQPRHENPQLSICQHMRVRRQHPLEVVWEYACRGVPNVAPREVLLPAPGHHVLGCLGELVRPDAKQGANDSASARAQDAAEPALGPPQLHGHAGLVGHQQPGGAEGDGRRHGPPRPPPA